MYKKVIAGVAALLMVATSVPMAEIAQLVPSVGISASAEESKAVKTVTKTEGTTSLTDKNKSPVSLGGTLNGTELTGKITVNLDKYGKTHVTLEPVPSQLSGTDSTYRIDMSNAITNAQSLIPSTSENGFDYSNCEVILKGKFNNNDNKNLDTVQFVDNVLTTVGDNLFQGCTNLTTVDFSNSKVTKLGNNVFSGCTNFAGNGSNTMDFTSTGITEIGNNTFQGCKTLTGVKFKDSTTSIGNSAFSGCTGINTTVEIPAAVKYIGNSAFSGCTSLQKVNFALGCAPELKSNVFNGCSALETVTADGKDYNTLPEQSFIHSTSPKKDGNKDVTDEYGDKVYETKCTVGTGVFSGCSKLQSFTVPNTFEQIGDSMFSGCSALNSITFDKTQSKCSVIGSGAFKDCKALTEVYLPDSTIALGSVKDTFNNTSNGGTFTNCSALKKLIVSDLMFNWGGSTFAGCWNLSLATYSKEAQLKSLQILVPDLVTTIPNYCFEKCSNITDVQLNNVSEIQKYAFAECISLPKITIPDAVVIINSHVFYKCTSLADVVYSPNLNTIDESAFEECTSLDTFTPSNADKYPNTIQFGANVGGVQKKAFYNCKTFKYMNFITDNTVKQDPKYPEGTKFSVVGESSFEGCKNFIGSGNNGTSSGTIEMPSTITVIQKSAFKNCESLYGITFKGNVTSVGSSAFSGCKALQGVIMNATITSLGDSAFEGCTALKNLPATVDNKSALTNITILNQNVFKNCDALTTATITKNITSIKDNAFENCDNLASLTFEADSKVTSIGANAFKDCKALATITAENNGKYNFPNSVNNIGNNAFAATAITSIAMNKPTSDKTTIGESAFTNCKVLKTVDLADTNLEKIAKSTFANDEALTDVKLPATLTLIDDSAFAECKALSTINSTEKGTYNLPENLKSIHNNAFKNNLNMTKFVIPAATDDIQLSAFNFNYTYKTEDLTNGTINPLKEIVVAEGNIKFKSVDGVLFSKDGKELYIYPNFKSDETYTIPAGVTTLIDSCFSSNDFIKHIIISSDVKNIEKNAFNKCQNLTSVDFSNNKDVIIDNNAFTSCKNVSIYAAQDSTAQKFADSKNDISYVDNNTKAVSIEFKEGKTLTIPLKSQKEYQLTPVIKTANGTETTDVLKYYSDNIDIATVDNNGKISFKAAGTVKITATNASGDVSATIDVTVEDKEGEVKPGNPSDSTGDNNNTNTGTKVTAPAKTAVSSVKRTGLSTLKAYWKKSSGATSYQVQLSSNKSFKGAKTVSTTKTSASFKASVSKTYYVRVRAVKTVNGKKAYSGWSTIKGIAAVKKPAKTVVTAKSTAKKTAKFSWRKVSGAAAYQVQYSSKSNFKGAKTILVSNKATSKTIKKLASKKKYYVRVRAFKKVAGKRYYGSWSAKKAVKIK